MYRLVAAIIDVGTGQQHTQCGCSASENSKSHWGRWQLESPDMLKGVDVRLPV